MLQEPCLNWCPWSWFDRFEPQDFCEAYWPRWPIDYLLFTADICSFKLLSPSEYGEASWTTAFIYLGFGHDLCLISSKSSLSSSSTYVVEGPGLVALWSTLGVWFPKWIVTGFFLIGEAAWTRLLASSEAESFLSVCNYSSSFSGESTKLRLSLSLLFSSFLNIDSSATTAERGSTGS